MKNRKEKSCELCRYYREGACLKTGFIQYDKRMNCKTFEAWKPKEAEVKNCKGCVDEFGLNKTMLCGMGDCGVNGNFKHYRTASIYRPTKRLLKPAK